MPLHRGRVADHEQEVNLALAPFGPRQAEVWRYLGTGARVERRPGRRVAGRAGRAVRRTSRAGRSRRASRSRARRARGRRPGPHAEARRRGVRGSARQRGE